MPGKIVKLLVQPGDRVALRQGLVVVEAMKMENQLTAEADGKIKTVAVKPGESVEVGQTLIEIERFLDLGIRFHQPTCFIGGPP